MAPLDFRSEITAYNANARISRWRSPTGWVTYRRLGTGPGLVVVPGIASTYRGYAALLNRLSLSFQTIIFDYPGDNPEDESNLSTITHQHLIGNLIGLADYLGLEQPTLFGPSFGSTVLLGALIEAPGRFGRSVTQGGFARRVLGPLERLAFAIGRRIPGTLARVPLRSRVLAIKNLASFRGEAEDRWPIYIDENGMTPIGPLAHRLDLVARIDLRERLRGVATEVLALQGADDHVIPIADWRELCQSLGNVEGLLLKGVGHQPHFTGPEQLAAIIENWVLRRSLPEAR